MNEQKKQVSIPLSILLRIIISLVIIYIITLAYTVFANKTNINFSLIGNENVTIEAGNDYVEEGFIATANEKDVKNKVSISSNIDKNKLGNYEIEYNLRIRYLGINETLFRKIKVVDTTKPQLTIESEKERTLDVGEKFSYPNYTAIDNYDGDITKNVKVESNLDLNKNGTYEINYLVSDSSGNETTDTIVIHVKKKKNPYVVVSISNQTLSYYEYDKLVLSSNVVTGINGKTPIGNFKVLNKATNIILKGKDYESFVNYWIAFKGSAFGFHDASWRSKFGGKIYQYNGSHGCVNMPYAKVRQLYNMISIGTPVYIKQ